MTHPAGMNTTLLSVDADTSVWLLCIHATPLTAADRSFT
jgi:hypothetical protein